MHDVTVRSALELLSALYIVHSGFAEAQILSMEANCRPAYPDNMPRVRVCGRIISVNGPVSTWLSFCARIVGGCSELHQWQYGSDPVRSVVRT